MRIKTLEGQRAEGRELVVCDGQITTVRFLVKEDGAGFTVSDVHVDEGTETVLWYKHHQEANYVLEGEGIVEDLGTGETHDLRPGVMLIVGPADRHRVRAKTAMRIISVFNPPLIGDERHDADGSYPPSA